MAGAEWVQGLNATTAPATLRGLTEGEVAARRKDGLGNDTELRTSRSYADIVRENLLTFFNLVLFAIGLLLLLMGSPVEAFITSGIGLVNVCIAVAQEVRAKRKLDRIALLTRPKATAIRAGQEKLVDPSEIVLGDVLVVGPGDQIVVDGVIVGDGRLDVDESLLSGESDPIPKTAGDELLSGSYCVTGRAAYECTKVGDDSYATNLTAGARKFKREQTPLQREVDLFVRVLLVVVAFFGILLALSTLVTAEVTPLEAVRSASVVMGIAPSSMFLMIVVAYALGAVRMADKGALVQQANSVESLCNVTVLCLDKTGTLTANRLRLEEIKALGAGASPNVAELRAILGTYARSVSAGNRTTQALIDACDSQPGNVADDVPFSSARRWSALALDGDALRGVYVLGAPEVLETCLTPGADPATALGQELERCTAKWADRGLRVLLFAHNAALAPLHDPEGAARLPADLIPLCLLGFGDELRPEARETLEGFRRAGIEPKIISGDHPDTVSALARQAGLLVDGKTKVVSGLDLDKMDEAQTAQIAAEATIFGRISPHQKEMLVQVLRDQGHYVGMTGDGVNDVLALKRANLAIAMQSGSQAARGVSDIILLNDSFAVLPETFAEGQRILVGMADILKLYMTRILSLALLITAISMLGAGFPFTATQSSLISLVTLSLPAFGLALWARPERVPKGNLTRRLMHFVLPAVIVTTFAGLAIYVYFYSITGGDYHYAQQALTYAMVAMGLLLVVFVEPPTRVWAGGDVVSRDWRPTLLAVGLLGAFALLLAVPPLREIYDLVPLHSPSDYLVIGGALIIWALVLSLTWRTRLVDRYLNVDLGGEAAASR